MIKLFFPILFLFLLPGRGILAQSCKDASVELYSTVQSNPPQITLNWAPNAGAKQYTLYRKF